MRSVRTRFWLPLAIHALLTPLVVSTPMAESAQVLSLAPATDADLEAGKSIFAAQCAWCHGTDGTGGTGPRLQGATLRHATDDRSLRRDPARASCPTGGVGFQLPSPPWAGVMATAGGLVFGGANEGNFYGPIRSGPMASLSDGKQRVAVAGGRGFYVFGMD